MPIKLVIGIKPFALCTDSQEETQHFEKKEIHMTVDHIEKSEHLEALEVSLREEWHAMIASGAPKADIIAKSKEYTAAYFASQNSRCKFIQPYRDGR